MKRITTMGICLVAVFAMTAVPAFAQPTGDFAIFKACPLTNPAVNLCFVAQSETGHFTVGTKTIKFKQLTLQGGSIENEETGAETFVAPNNGEPTLSPVPLKVPGGLTRVSLKGFPQALKERWQIAKVVGGLKDLKLTVELAGQPGISRTNLLFQEGTALFLPVRIKLTSPYRDAEGKGLLGEECLIGNEAETIPQNLTSGETHPPEGFSPIFGKVGFLEFKDEFQIVYVKKNLVVDNTYAVPVSQGCGGPNSGVVGPAIDALFGLPAPAGQSVTEIKGNLFNSTAEATKASEK